MHRRPNSLRDADARIESFTTSHWSMQRRPLTAGGVAQRVGRSSETCEGTEGMTATQHAHVHFGRISPWRRKIAEQAPSTKAKRMAWAAEVVSRSCRGRASAFSALLGPQASHKPL